MIDINKIKEMAGNKIPTDEWCKAIGDVQKTNQFMSIYPIIKLDIWGDKENTFAENNILLLTFQKADKNKTVNMFVKIECIVETIDSEN